MWKRSGVLLLGVALGGCTLAFEDWAGEVSYVNFAQAEEVGSETRLDAEIELSVGELTVSKGAPDLLYELDLNYNELAFKPEVQFERDNGEATLRFELSGEGKSVRRMGDTRLDLRFTPDRPLNLHVETGVSESNLDLTDLSLEGLVLESGVGETELSMLATNKSRCQHLEVSAGVGSLEVIGLGNFRFDTFQFRGGVGGTTLDFSGDWQESGEVEIEVGVGGVEIRLPRNVGAEIRVSKSFLSGVDLPEFEKRGDTYYSRNLETAEKVLRFRIRAGIGGISLDWI